MKTTPPKKAAAGLPSILKSMDKSLRDMGPVRSAQVFTAVNQKEGFDCPGCAWPEKDEHRSHFEFCENGAKAVSDEATRERVTPEFFARHSIHWLEQQSDVWLNAQGRLTHPVVRRRGSEHYEPIQWAQAFELIARELKSLPSPDAAAFYTSGRTSNEAAYLYQLFVRMYGTNNLPDCSNMCHESSGEALREAIGVGKGTVSLDDFALADAIFIIGQNPGTNHPRMMATLQAAARRGCEIVTINPLPEAGLLEFRHPQEVSGILGFGTKLSTLHLPVRINGDVALLKGIMKEMIEHPDKLDHDFIQAHTVGFDAFIAALQAADWNEIVEQSGIDRESIRKAAEVALRSARTIACWAMGLTQHVNAVANIQEVTNLLMMRGNIGRPGAGVCPVRGHSNVQGDRTMGIWERPPDSFLDAIGREFNFEPPRHHGLDTVATIQAMLEGKVKVFFALGGNFLSAAPDTERTSAALQQCALTVQVSTKLNRAHLITGEQALILPCLGRTEQDIQANGPQYVTTENSMSVVSRSEGRLEPASPQLKSEVAIVAKLANATLGVDWSRLAADYSHIRQHISNTIRGFEQYSDKVNFTLPNTARERKWITATGKANFTVHPLPPAQLGSQQFLLMTIRSHDQFNTTIYSENDRYRGIEGGRRVVFINEGDGHRNGELVDICGGDGRIARGFTVVHYPIPRRCLAAYFPEANVLVSLDSVAEKSNTPASKSVVVTLSKAQLQ